MATTGSDNDAKTLSHDYAFCPGDKGFYEYYTLTGENRMLRLADVPARNNVIIKYDRYLLRSVSE